MSNNGITRTGADGEPLGSVYTFSRSDIRRAEHEFAENIRKYFGEVWRIKSDGEYLGVDWWCRHPVAFYGGLWRLCQVAKHKGAIRAAGRMEVREANTVIRFILLYNRKEHDDKW